MYPVNTSNRAHFGQKDHLYEERFWRILYHLGLEEKIALKDFQCPEVQGHLSQHRLWLLAFEHLIEEDQQSTAHLEQQKAQELTFEGLKMSHEQQRLIASFESSHLQYLFWKGPRLSQKLFSNPTLRCSGDLDLLVHRESWDQTVEHLLGLGYEKIGNDWDVPISKNKHPAYHLHHPKLDVLLDLGYDVVIETAHLNLSQHIFSSPPQVRSSHELECLLLMIHGSKHMWERWIWLLDIQIFIKKEDHFFLARVYHLAKSWGAEAFVLDTLFLLQGIWGGNLPKSIQNDMTQHPRPPALQVTPEPVTRLNYALNLKSKSPNMTWWNFLMDAISRTPDDLERPYFTGYLQRLKRLVNDNLIQKKRS